MGFIPYGKQTINDDDIQSVVDVLKSDFLTTGPQVEAFEKAIAKYCNVKYCISVSNGTAALHLSSLALLKQGDKVLTTPNSFLATSNSALYANAEPIFVDITEDGNIDLDICEQYLASDKSIKALCVVHFSGKMINQKRLQQLKEKYHIKVIEDCAHSLGAEYEGIKAGSCFSSDISVFSFHPVKSITTGEGGAILTNDEAIYKQLLLLRNSGIESDNEELPWHYNMKTLGFNYRLTDISCALGLSQLKRLDDFIAKRKELAKIYDEAFSKCNNIKPLYMFTESSSYHLYVVRIDFDNLTIDKKDFVLHLREKKIGVQYHYIPINKQPYYRDLGYGEEETPLMDRYYKETISLPLYPMLTNKEQLYVIATILEFLKKSIG